MIVMKIILVLSAIAIAPCAKSVETPPADITTTGIHKHIDETRFSKLSKVLATTAFVEWRRPDNPYVNATLCSPTDQVHYSPVCGVQEVQWSALCHSRRPFPCEIQPLRSIHHHRGGFHRYLVCTYCIRFTHAYLQRDSTNISLYRDSSDIVHLYIAYRQKKYYQTVINK